MEKQAAGSSSAGLGDSWMDGVKRPPPMPHMSVVICSYNGALTLGRAIESLLAQGYPRGRYEVIVVDDGSTDSTFEIASKYPVKVVRHDQNLGIAAARSTGLHYARGDVYVCFDDDCLVGPDWLQTLAAGYQQLPEALGIGSVVAHPSRVSGLVDQFMAATGSGNAPSLRLGASGRPLRRFVAYLADQLGLGTEAEPCNPYPVRQLYAATASFPTHVLRAVSDWDSELRFHSDVDVCARIAHAFPERHFYVVPTARLTHDPKMSLMAFVRRPYRKGRDNLAYYRRNRLTPPIYPWPIVWLCVAGLAIAIDPFWGLVTAGVAPQVLYVWWPIRFTRERNLWMLAFPYLQLAEEWSTIAGLLHGCAALRKESPQVQVP